MKLLEWKTLSIVKKRLNFTEFLKLIFLFFPSVKEEKTLKISLLALCKRTFNHCNPLSFFETPDNFFFNLFFNFTLNFSNFLSSTFPLFQENSFLFIRLIRLIISSLRLAIKLPHEKSTKIQTRYPWSNQLSQTKTLKFFRSFQFSCP